MKNSKKLKVLGIVTALVIVIIAVFFIVDSMYYAGLYKKVNVELGNKLPEATAFLKKTGEIEYITDLSEIDVTIEGAHELLVRFNGKEKKVYLEIKDTIPPKVSVKDVSISVYDKLEAMDLILDITDESKVRASYKIAPEFGQVGSHEAVILVEDEAGNKTEAVSKVNICKVVSYVEYKYGEAYPVAQDFIFDERDTGELITDVSEMIGKPGTYYVTIAIDGKNYKSKLIVLDENEPVVVGRDAEITREDVGAGNTLSPDKFIIAVDDEDDVYYYFVDKPDYTKGDEIDVKIAVTDTSGNTTIIDKKIYVVENLGFDMSIGEGTLTDSLLSEKLDCEGAFLVSGSVDADKLGRYPIVVNVNGSEKSIYVNVIDKDSPKAKPVAVTLDKKQDIVPDMFVSEVTDSTKVSLSFDTEPDAVNRGLQKVRVILTDEGGNKSYIDSTLDIQYDAVLPAILGAADVSTYIRQKPDYLLGISAMDDVDGDIAVTVDDSKVDYETAGEYPVTYTAKDTSGNTVTQKIILTVKNIDRALVDGMADEILEKITDDSMTVTEKLWAAYVYVQENVRYINQADQSSVEKAAYDSFTLGTGDCYSYGALMEVFAERLGGETIFVRRYEGKYNHYWRLCNLGTGWYHLDATPRNSEFKCFMKTDAEVLSESATYWNYDKTLYPEIATESYGY